MKNLKFLILLVVMLTTGLITKAQNDIRFPDNHFWYSVSIGKGDATVTNPNAWLEIGKYGTNKGLILPRANVFNIAAAEGNFAYDINTKSLWFHNGTVWTELLTGSEQYDSAYLNAKYFPTTGILRLYRVDGDSTSLNIAQTLSLGGTSLSISGGNSVSLSTTNVAEGSNLYFTTNRVRQSFTINNGLTFNNSTGLVQFGGSLLQNTNLDLGSFTFNIVSGANPIFKTANDGTITLGSYGTRNDGGFEDKVLFVDANGVLKYGVTSFLTAEVDPIFTASPAASITNTHITNWNAAYNAKINSIGYNNGVLTLNKQDGSSLTANVVPNLQQVTTVGNRTPWSIKISGSDNGSTGSDFEGLELSYLSGVGASTILNSYQRVSGVETSIPMLIQSGKVRWNTSTGLALFIDDNTNSRRVGIGNDVPEAKLHVQGNIIATAQFTQNGSGRTVIGDVTNGGLIEGKRHNGTTWIAGEMSITGTTVKLNGPTVLSSTIKIQGGSPGIGKALIDVDGTGLGQWTTITNGTVTSVGLTAPSVFSVSGSPVTSAGTLGLSFATGQPANQVLATPNGTTGALGLRSLVAADIPNLDASKITTGTIATARMGSGTANSTTFLAGNNTWQDFATTFIINQPIGTPQTANFDISGNGKANTFTATNYNIGAFSSGRLTASGDGTTVSLSFPSASVTPMTWTSGRITNVDGSLNVTGNGGQITFNLNGNTNTKPFVIQNFNASTFQGNKGNKLVVIDTVSGRLQHLRIDSVIANLGTVNSVALALPSSVFSVSGSPVTNTGTLTGSLINQNANTVFAGPTTGAATVPTFRTLVANDIPNLDAAKITSGTIATARLGSGTANSTTALFGDQTYKTVVTAEVDPTAIKNQTTEQTANFNISGNGTIAGITTTPFIYSPNGSTLVLWGQNDHIEFIAGTSSTKMTLDTDGRLGIGKLPNSVRASYLEVAGNIWSEDAYILGASGNNAPTAEFGLQGTNDAFVRTMSAGGDLDFLVNASTLVARVNGTTNNFEVANRIKISGGTPGAGKVLMDADGTGLAQWATIGGGTGTVTSVGLTSSDITVGGTSPITTAGTFTLTLPNINSNVGTFNNLTVNAKGQVTAASNVAYLTSYTETDPIVSARTLTFSNGTGISVSGGTQNLGANRTWTITNTAPDQTVTMTNGTGISVTGTYPNFTITNTSPNTNQSLDQVLTVGNSSSQGMTVGQVTTASVNSGGPGTLTLGANGVGTILINSAGNVTNVTGKLGIGITPDIALVSSAGSVGSNPIARFESQRAAFGNALEVSNATGTIDLEAKAWSTGTTSWSGASTLRLNANGGLVDLVGNLQVYNNQITMTGPVGINNASPTEALTVTGNIYASGTVTAAGGGFNSLRTLKKDITDFTGDALTLIDNLKLYNFKYKSNDKDDFIGMIIDEKNEVPKELLMKDGTAINTYNTISLLIKSIQQLNERLNNLENKINESGTK